MRAQCSLPYQCCVGDGVPGFHAADAAEGHGLLRLGLVRSGIDGGALEDGIELAPRGKDVLIGLEGLILGYGDIEVFGERDEDALLQRELEEIGARARAQGLAQRLEIDQVDIDFLPEVDVSIEPVQVIAVAERQFVGGRGEEGGVIRLQGLDGFQGRFGLLDRGAWLPGRLPGRGARAGLPGTG